MQIYISYLVMAADVLRYLLMHARWDCELGVTESCRGQSNLGLSERVEGGGSEF